MGYIIGLSSFV